MPQVGPITMWVISTTLTPSSGKSVPVIVFSRCASVARLGLWARCGKHNLSDDAFTPA
jgi:hypothetical protein